MRRLARLALIAMTFAAPAQSETLREAISGKVLYFPGERGQYILFSLNPDGTGIGQEIRGGKARPEAIRWRLEGRRFCVSGKGGGMSTTGAEQCAPLRVKGRRIWLKITERESLRGRIRERRQ